MPLYDNSLAHTYQLLDSLRIPYKILKDSTNDAISGTITCKALGYPPSQVFKTIMVFSCKKCLRFIAVLPADRKLDLKLFSAIVGIPCYKPNKRNISFDCSEEEGLFGPFFPENFTVYLDNSAQTLTSIVVNAGGAGNYIEIAVSDFVSATGCRFGELSSRSAVELSAKNYTLPIGSKIEQFQISTVKAITPLDIFYEAKNTETGQTVNICEFFPRFRGCYSIRTVNGEGVGWLEYTNDMVSRYEPCFDGFEHRMFHYVKDITVNSPKVIRQMERNDTFYTVYEPPCGKSIKEICSEEGALRWDEIKTALLPLIEQIHNEPKYIGAIRPDTVYFDRQNQRACLLPFCSETDVFRRRYGLQYMLNLSYDPFMIDDETAFYRVLCYAVAPEQWNDYYCCDFPATIRELLPKEDADWILAGANL